MKKLINPLLVKCDTCIYGKLCVYRATYEGLNMEVMTALPVGEHPFSAEANCKHYKEENLLLAGGGGMGYKSK